jgi:predicted P-loop ATPase
MSTQPTTLLALVQAGMKQDEIALGCLGDWPDYTVNQKTDVIKVHATIKNVGHFLTRFGITIRDDAFRWRYVLEGVPGRDQLDDKAVLDFKFACECCGLSIGKDTLWDALMAIAHLRTTHELRDLFDELEAAWLAAGNPAHLDTWLEKFAYVDSDAYTRAVSCKPLIAAVRRVRSPGYAFKYMPVLEGEQDCRKSGALRILGMDKYFDDNLEFGASTKEIMEISSGVLIHEVPELSKMSGREVETVKAMMSRQKDKARLAYGRSTTEMPRQFVLWGTSNDRKYLKDPTGSVRFWPVWSAATLAKPIDTSGLSKVVRLMWGEAAYRERQGENCYLEGEALRLAQIAQGERYDGGDIHDAITDAVEGKEGFIVGHALLSVCDLVDGQQHNTTIAKAIKNAMTKNGWQPGRRYLNRNGKLERVRGWVRGHIPEGEAVTSYWDNDPNSRRLKAVTVPVKAAA